MEQGDQIAGHPVFLPGNDIFQSGYVSYFQVTHIHCAQENKYL
jgi:hypothetical protein